VQVASKLGLENLQDDEAGLSPKKIALLGSLSDKEADIAKLSRELNRAHMDLVKLRADAQEAQAEAEKGDDEAEVAAAVDELAISKERLHRNEVELVDLRRSLRQLKSPSKSPTIPQVYPPFPVEPSSASAAVVNTPSPTETSSQGPLTQMWTSAVRAAPCTMVNPPSRAEPSSARGAFRTAVNPPSPTEQSSGNSSLSSPGEKLCSPSSRGSLGKSGNGTPGKPSRTTRRDPLQAYSAKASIARRDAGASLAKHSSGSSTPGRMLGAVAPHVRGTQSLEREIDQRVLTDRVLKSIA